MNNRTIKHFLDMMVAEKGASTNTVKAYKYDILQFFAITGADVQNIARKHVSDYINELTNLYYTPKSQARKLSALRDFCKFYREIMDV